MGVMILENHGTRFFIWDVLSEGDILYSAISNTIDNQ